MTAHLESFPITRLQALAAVRFDEVPARCYDEGGCPVSNVAARRKGKVSVARHLRRLALSIRSRIRFMFHECNIAVIESETALSFEVRSMGGARGGASTERAIFAAPLATLLDVAAGDAGVTSQAAGSKETLCKTTPHNHHPSQRQTTSPQRSPRQQESRSRLFGGDYGDLALELTFRVAKPSADDRRLANPFTRVNLRFSNAGECKTWTTYFQNRYISLLLEGVRNGNGGGVEGDAFAAPERRPSPCAVVSSILTVPMLESYVNYFLSGVDHDNLTATALNDTGPGEPPCGGVLRVGSYLGHKRRLCRLAMLPGATKLENTSCELAGGCLIIQDVSLSRRWLRPQEVRIPLHGLRVVVDDAEGMLSSTFFLESTLLGSSGGPLPVPLRGQGATVVSSSPSLVDTAQQASKIAIVECDAGTAIDRARWLAWLELLLGQPPLYLAGLEASRFSVVCS